MGGKGKKGSGTDPWQELLNPSLLCMEMLWHQDTSQKNFGLEWVINALPPNALGIFRVSEDREGTDPGLWECKNSMFVDLLALSCSQKQVFV